MTAENPADTVTEQAASVAIEAFVLSDAEHEWTIPDTVRALHAAGLLADPAERDEIKAPLVREIKRLQDQIARAAMKPGQDRQKAVHAYAARAERAEVEVARLKAGWCPCVAGRPQDCKPEDWPLSDRHGLPARLRDAFAEWDELAKENAELRATIDQVRQLADEWQPNGIQSPHWAAVRLRALLRGDRTKP